MKALAILAGCALALLLLSLVRVGALITYGQGGLALRLTLGPGSIPIYPPKKGKKKRHKKRGAGKRKAPSPEEASPKAGTLAAVNRALPPLAAAAGRLKRKIRVDCLHVDVTAAAADPAKAALCFGYVNMALGLLWPLVDHNFNVREHRIRTAVDFTIPEPVLQATATLSLTIGQGVALFLGILFKFIRQSAPHKTEQKEAV